MVLETIPQEPRRQGGSARVGTPGLDNWQVKQLAYFEAREPPYYLALPNNNV